MKFLKISCLAVALLLGSSSTAQAQNAMDCIAGSSPNTVRAEGITEVVGDIQVRCRQERGPHLGLPAMVPVVELSCRMSTSPTGFPERASSISLQWLTGVAELI